MKERQNAEKAISPIEANALFELSDVGNDVVVGQHDAFRFAGASAGEDHCREIVRLNLSANQHGRRHQPRGKKRFHFVAGSNVGDDILQQDCFAGHINLDALKKRL